MVETKVYWISVAYLDFKPEPGREVILYALGGQQVDEILDQLHSLFSSMGYTLDYDGANSQHYINETKEVQISFNVVRLGYDAKLDSTRIKRMLP